VQVNRHVEPFAPKAPSEREILEQSSGTPAALRDDHVVEIRITANDRSRRRLDEIRDVRAGMLPPQRTDNRCGENDVADQAQADEEDPQS
jgi:hypothetical protein